MNTGARDLATRFFRGQIFFFWGEIQFGEGPEGAVKTSGLRQLSKPLS